MSGSLLMTVQDTPMIEPLPAYRRDPETSSVRSSAPSYVSEAPTYHSTIPTSSTQAGASAGRNTQRIGLPPAGYAPGFHHPRNIDRHGLTYLNFNSSNWSPAYSSPQSRQYHNVAARRAQRTNLAMIEEQNLLATLTNTMIFPTFSPLMLGGELGSSTTTTTITTTASVTPTRSTQAQTSITSNPSSPSTVTQRANSSTNQSINLATHEPISPLEDPDLVGHAAATVARERRLYIARERNARREQEAKDAAAIREESMRWDFLLSQMADWEERERGWKAFSKKLDNKTAKSSARKVLFRFWK